VLQARLEHPEQPERQVLLALRARLGLIEPGKLRVVPVLPGPQVFPVLQELLPLLVLPVVQEPQLWQALCLRLRKAPDWIVWQQSMVCRQVISQVLLKRGWVYSGPVSESKRSVYLPAAQDASRQVAPQSPESSQQLIPQ
jgi:hypothetical protein